MNMRLALAVFRKDGREILRDRKTLFFLFIFPIVVIPLVMYGFSTIAVSVALNQASKSVTVAASPEHQEAYLRMAQETFASTPTGSLLQLANTRAAQALLPDSLGGLTEDLPEDLFTEPRVFHQWAQRIAGKFEEALNNADFSQMPTDAEIPSDLSFDLDSLREMEKQTNAMMAVFQGVGLVNFADPAELDAPPVQDGPLPEALKERPDGAKIQALIELRRIDAFLEIEGDPESAAREDGESVRVRVIHDSTIPNSGEAASRLRRLANAASTSYIQLRLRREGFPPEFQTPVTITQANIATQSEQAFYILGGLIPYLVITFAYLGAFYPAVDIGAGEKERSTLETILLAPVQRIEIALGKYLVLFSSSLIAALLGVASLVVSAGLIIPAGVLESFNIEIDPLAVASIVLLIVPPAAIMAGALLSISIYARSFKEAQNYMAPTGLLVILPVALAMVPGIEIDLWKSLIPFLNVALLSRHFLSGDVQWLYYFTAIFSSGALAVLMLAITAWMFSREQVLFRG